MGKNTHNIAWSDRSIDRRNRFRHRSNGWKCGMYRVGHLHKKYFSPSSQKRLASITFFLIWKRVLSRLALGMINEGVAASIFPFACIYSIIAQKLNRKFASLSILSFSLCLSTLVIQCPLFDPCFCAEAASDIYDPCLQLMGFQRSVGQLAVNVTMTSVVQLGSM